MASFMEDWSNGIKSISDQGWSYFGIGFYWFLPKVQSQNNVFVENEVILPEIHKDTGRLDSRAITIHLFLQRTFVNQ